LRPVRLALGARRLSAREALRNTAGALLPAAWTAATPDPRGWVQPCAGPTREAAFAGLRAHEARYFKNKYDHVFTVEPASNATTTIDWVHRILKEERDIVVSSRPLEATAFQVENIRIAYVFYESGLSINVMYTVDDPKERAVGFKLSEGMEVPAELASRFKFASQKSKLAGTIRGSFFAFKNEY
jgi:hypothetical protein